MRAALVTELPANDFRLGEAPDPIVAEPDDVVVRVSCCGVCGTDLHILSGRSYRPRLPFVLGHELVGTVVGRGPSAVRARIGARVTASIFRGNDGACALCRSGRGDGPCRSGDERLCVELQSIVGVLEAPGAFAEYVALKDRQLVEIPAVLDDHGAATLADAGATAYNAVRTARVREGDVVVIAGAGPVGVIAAQALAARGCDTTLIEPAPARRHAAGGLGLVAVAGADAIRTAPDHVIECSGSSSVVGWAVQAMRPRGRLVLAGYATVPELELAHVARKELQILGVRSGRPEDLVEVLRDAAAGRLLLPRVSAWPLEGINAAFDALRTGRVDGKVVIDVQAPGTGATKGSQ